MASGLDKQESIFTPSLRPWRFSPLNLSYEIKRNGKVTAQEHVERNKYGFFRFKAAKSSLKVHAVEGCVRDTFEVELPLITHKFQVCNEFSAFRKNYLQKLE